MKFTKEQEDILRKAYNRKRFTKKLYSKIMTEDITLLEKRLDKIGYKIYIRPIKGAK